MTVAEEKAGDRVRRAKNGRPYIKDPVSGKEVQYTRVSTFAKALSDGDSLSWWKMERMAIGLVLDPSILRPAWKAIGDSQGDVSVLTREVLSPVITRSLEAGGANSAADWGTTMHAMADLIDFSDASFAREAWDLPETIWEAMDAYVQITADMQMVSGEQFVVQDELRCAGSYDRTVLYKGMNVVADLKTGMVRYPDHRVQVSVYAHSNHYNVETGERESGPLDNASRELGLIVHLPRPGINQKPSVIEVDTRKGWQQAMLARQVREARTRGKDITPMEESN